MLELANKILLHVGQCKVVRALVECDSALFCQLYETFSGNPAPDICRKTGGSEAFKCQMLVDTLARHLRPHVTLEHIKGVDVASGDVLAIRHLLDIFALLLHVPEDNADHFTAHHLNNSPSKGCSAVMEGAPENLNLTNTSHFLSIEPLSPTQSIETVTDCQPLSTLPPSPVQSPAHTPISQNLKSPLHHSTPHITTKSRVFFPMPTPPRQDQLPVGASSKSNKSATEGHSPMSFSPTNPSMSPQKPNKDQVQLFSGTEVKRLKEEEDEEEEKEVESEEDEEGERDSEEEEEDEQGDESKKDTTEERETARGADSAKELGRDAVLSLLCQNYIKELKKQKKVQHTKCKRLQHTPSKHEYADSGFPTVGTNVLTLLDEQFPGIYTSPTTLRRLWQKQIKQMMSLTTPSTASTHKGDGARVVQVSEQHRSLLQLIRRDLEHTRRMQRLNELKQEQQAVKSSLHNQRLAAARARRYYNEYELRLKAKLQRRRTKEEQVFRQAFEELLELQKERVREVKKYTKEKQQEKTRLCNQQMEALENFYKDQLLMLAESVAREKLEVEVREKAQHELMTKLRQELRHKMEDEIRRLQGCLDREDDVVHFRQLDADQLASRLGALKFT